MIGRTVFRHSLLQVMAPFRAISTLSRARSSPSLGKPLVRLFGFIGRHAEAGFVSPRCTLQRNAAPPVSSYQVYRGNRIGWMTRSYVCSSPVLTTHEIEEDFDTEPCKHSRNYSNHADTESIAQKASIRIEPPRAGFLDKEVRRNRRTQPFTEKCWMQSLGVGLYREKLKNRRSFCSAALPSNRPEEKTGGPPFTELPDSLSEKRDKSLILQHKPIVEDDDISDTEADDNVDELTESDDNVDDSSDTEVDDTVDELGVIDTDSDDDEHDSCGGSEPEMSSIIKEESIEALEVSLRDMETSFSADDPRIGTVCLRLAQLYDSADEDPDKILSYAERALKILGASNEVTFDTAMCHHVIGSAYFKMEDSEKAISHLEQSGNMLEKVSGTNEKAFGTIKYAVQILLGHTKLSMGKQEEALKHYKVGVAINEQILEPGNPVLARSYQQSAEAHMEAEEYEEALKLCLKALPIYENFYGPSSSEVAVLRRLMSLIYKDIEDYEKVLAQHDIIRPILVKLGKSKETASLDLASGEALIELERYKEAILVLKECVQETKETSRFHGHALVLIAKAYAELKEGKNAAKYGKRAMNALKEKKYSAEAGSSLMVLSSVYQQLNEVDQAMVASKTALQIFEHHPEQQPAIAEIEGQVGVLYMFMGKIQEGVPYLESSAKKIEEHYGEDCEELLAVYNHIAIAYLELGKFEEALAKLEAAKAIAEDNYGPEDAEMLGVYTNLVNSYAGLERFNEAIKCQKLIVEAVKKGGSLYDISLEGSQKRLEELMLQAKKSGARPGGRLS